MSAVSDEHDPTRSGAPTPLARADGFLHVAADLSPLSRASGPWSAGQALTGVQEPGKRG